MQARLPDCQEAAGEGIYECTDTLCMYDTLIMSVAYFKNTHIQGKISGEKRALTFLCMSFATLLHIYVYICFEYLFICGTCEVPEVSKLLTSTTTRSQCQTLCTL